MQYIIGIFIAFFLAIIILTKKGRNRADVILGIWMIVIGIHIFGYYGFISGLTLQLPGSDVAQFTLCICTWPHVIPVYIGTHTPRQF